MHRDGPHDGADRGLSIALDVPLPTEVEVGAGTALFVCGRCFHPAAQIRELRFVLDGDRQPVMAHGMPRLDTLRELHPDLDPYQTRALQQDHASAEDPHLHSYASGFWGLVEISGRSRSEEALELRVEAELAGGGVASADLGSIKVAGPLASPVSIPAEVLGQSGPLVAVCMATHNPPSDLLTRQLQSIRGQDHRRWLCVVSDDCSRPERFAALEEAIAADPRFILSRSPRRLGFYRNFERALSMVPGRVDYVALADQDDCWHPDKLSTLLASIGSAQLVYSDARVVTRDGELISDTWWSRRANNHRDLLSVLVANSVTGAASLMRRQLLDDALPFPPAQFAHYHDHWLGLTALSLGDIAFVTRPLYDYVQHSDAALGHAAANRMPALRERLRGRGRGSYRDRVRLWRMHYFVDACRLLEVATILQLRGGRRISLRKRRRLERFARADGSLAAIAVLGLRGLRELVGRPETLGAEWMLFWAFSWRRLLALTARERPQRRLRLDAVPPPDLAPRPARDAAPTPAVRAMAAKIAPLDLAPGERAPIRVNLLIPTFDLEHFFGGYITKLNLARRLGERGLRVRIVTVDPVPPLPRHWRQTIESYRGLNGLFETVEVAFGREGGSLEVSPEDRFIATTWWTAHIAHAATGVLGREGFLYLIQEYEPFTFAMGTYAALAAQSYRFPHHALFSSELLRDYFRRHALGVYGDGRPGDERSRSFENAITDFVPPTAGELARRTTRKLLFYARPEHHAARNLFELGILALGRARENGAFADGWELNGIGTVEGPRRLALGEGAGLNLLARSDQASYAELLREHDIGLALMYTPHPSLVPIEMAAAGMVTVTNSFENKSAEAMAAISPNIITSEPSIEAIAGCLRQAAAAVEDFDRRASASAVRWSRDWAQTFDDRLLAWVARALDRPVTATNEDRDASSR